MGQVSCSDCNCNKKESEANQEIKLTDTLKSDKDIVNISATDISKHLGVEILESSISHSSPNHTKFNAAVPKVIKIQSLWRGYQTRKMYSFIYKPKSKFFSTEKKVSTNNVKPPFTFKSGSVYNGEWNGNDREGIGTQTWPDGTKYEGNWKMNKANGHGKF